MDWLFIIGLFLAGLFVFLWGCAELLFRAACFVLAVILTAVARLLGLLDSSLAGSKDLKPRMDTNKRDRDGTETQATDDDGLRHWMQGLEAANERGGREAGKEDAGRHRLKPVPPDLPGVGGGGEEGDEPERLGGLQVTLGTSGRSGG